jgi:hypothetical protein
MPACSSFSTINDAARYVTPSSSAARVMVIAGLAQTSSMSVIPKVHRDGRTDTFGRKSIAAAPAVRLHYRSNALKPRTAPSLAVGFSVRFLGSSVRINPLQGARTSTLTVAVAMTRFRGVPAKD